MMYVAKGVKCTGSFTIVDNPSNDLINSILYKVVTFKCGLSIGKFR
jgi:hypothetical protein